MSMNSAGATPPAGLAGTSAHPASWWAQFDEASDRFDAAKVTESLAEVITAAIASPLLRREAEIAADVVVRHLRVPQNEEMAARAAEGVNRLVTTVERLTERSTAQDTGIAETVALCHVLHGRYGDGAAAIEPVVGTMALLKAFMAALWLEQVDRDLTLRLLRAGQRPAQAVQSGLAVGKYGWWPSWLLTVVTERALAGTLDQAAIVALDQCAYAELSPRQARIARRLLAGDAELIDASARRLESLGEPNAAARLRDGDLTTVALAARMTPV